VLEAKVISTESLRLCTPVCVSLWLLQFAFLAAAAPAPHPAFKSSKEWESEGNTE